VPWQPRDPLVDLVEQSAKPGKERLSSIASEVWRIAVRT
jgi:hypothetical protein